MPSKLTRTTTDHEEIRRWAEERGGEPAEVERTERDGETGMIRIDFPGFSGAGSLKHITWDEWFEKFDSAGLALVYQERTAGGEESNFNKLVGRETAEARARGENEASRRSPRGRGGSSRREARSSTGARARRRSGGGTAAGRGSRRTRGGAGRRGARASPRRREREVPRTVAARLTGRARSTPEEGGGTRRRSSRTGRASTRGGSKRTRSTARTPRRTGRRSSRRGRRR